MACYEIWRGWRYYGIYLRPWSDGWRVWLYRMQYYGWRYSLHLGPIVLGWGDGIPRKIIAQKVSIDTATPMGRMFLTICLAFAQMERDLISERTKAGIAAHKARGEPDVPLDEVEIDD